MQTKTYEDWSKYLGARPKRLGVVARMYADNTLSYLTDGLRNIFYKDEKANTFQISDSLLFEWQTEVNNIKHVEFADVPEQDGANGSERIIITSMTSSVLTVAVSNVLQFLILFASVMKNLNNCLA